MAQGPITYQELFENLGPGSRDLQEFSGAVQGLNRSYKAFAKALDSDAGRINAGLATLRESATGLKAQVAATSTGTDQQRTQLSQLSAEVARLAKEQLQYKAALEGIATTRRTAKEGTEGLTKALREQQQALKTAYAAGNMEGAQKAALNVLQLKQQTDQLNKALRGTTSELTAANGSYDRANQQLKNLRAEYRALGDTMEGASPRATELAGQIQALDTKLRAADKTLGQGYRAVGEYTQSILAAVAALNQEKTALEQSQQALKTQAQATGLSAQQQDRLQKEIRETDTELTRVNGALRSYGVGVAQGGAATSKFSAGAATLTQSLLGSYYGLQGLATAAQEVFTNLVAYSDQLVDVRKTTGLSADEAERFADSLKAIPTRTSLSELLEIGKIGGQIGKTKGEILDFTKAIDVAALALADDFSGGVGEIAQTLGKLELVFRKSLGPDQEENIINIGSALNEVSATSAATAPFLADVALRVGATAANAKLGLQDVFGFASVLQNVGFSAETSGTSLSRMFNTLSTKTKESFKIAQLADANLTLKDFTRLIDQDFQKALSLLLQGLNKGGTTTTKFNTLLGTLKLSSGDAKAVITTLARNTELFAEQQKVANQQLKQGTSLAAEAALKNNNLAASYEKTKKVLVDLFTDGALADGVKFLIDDTRGQLELLANGFRKLGDGVAYLGEKLGISKKAQQNVYGATSDTTKALLEQATAAEKLLKEYQQLATTTNRTVAQQQQLEDTALALQKSLGQQVVSLDENTGRLTVNTGAVEDAIFARRRLSAESEKRLERYVANAEKAVASTQALQASLTNKVGVARFKLDTSGIDPARLKEVEDYVRERQELFGKNVQIGPSSGFSQAEVTAVEKYLDAQRRLGTNAELLAKQQADVANAQAALNGVRKAGIGATTDATTATEEDTTATEENTAVLDRNAKARAEARKAELQAQVQQQERLIEQAKKAQDEASRLFEAKNLNKDTYSAQVGGLQEQITAAERKASGLRIDIITEEAKAKNAEILNELAGIKNKRKVSNAEIEDAERAASNKRLAVVRETRTAIERELDTLQDKLIVAPLEFKMAGIDPDDLAKAEKDLDLANERGLRRMQEAADEEKRIREKSVQDAKDAEERKRAIIEASLDLAFRALDSYATIQANSNAAIIAGLEKGKEAELKIAGESDDRQYLEAKAKLEQVRANSLAAAGENADKRRQIEEQYARDSVGVEAQKDNLKAQIEAGYEKRIKAARTKEAQDKRRAALFDIALSTAVAVAKSFAESPVTFGLPFSAIALAAGALQAAVVLSTPLPQYAKGRQGGPAEWAVVGERGPELVSGPGGAAQLFSGPTITYLPQGGTVHTATKTQQILRESRFVEDRLLTHRYGQELQERTRAIERPASASVGAGALEKFAEAGRRDNDRLIAAMRDRTEYRLTENGLEQFTRRGDSVTRHVNRRYRRNG